MSEEIEFPLLAAWVFCPRCKEKVLVAKVELFKHKESKDLKGKVQINHLYKRVRRLGGGEVKRSE